MTRAWCGGIAELEQWRWVCAGSVFLAPQMASGSAAVMLDRRDWTDVGFFKDPQSLQLNRLGFEERQ